MDPDEIEFLAERTIIRIVPNFVGEKVTLIGGDVGPFTAGLSCSVPLWLGMNLKQQQKCTIVAPDWMNVDTLEDLLKMEKQSKSFAQVPSEHYMVEAKLLLGCAPEDISKADEIRTLIKDIWDTRMSKIRTSMDALIREGVFYATLNNLTPMEINSMRPLLPQTLDQLYRLKVAAIDNQHSQNTTSSFNTSSRS